jgi:hypothetical protein
MQHLDIPFPEGHSPISRGSGRFPDRSLMVSVGLTRSERYMG